MNKPKHVCPPDCEFRSAECHATCKTYREFEELKRKEYKERAIRSAAFMPAQKPCRCNANYHQL